MDRYKYPNVIVSGCNVICYGDWSVYDCFSTRKKQRCEQDTNQDDRKDRDAKTIRICNNDQTES